MGTALVGFLGGLLGGLIGLAGVVVTTRSNERAERERRAQEHLAERERRDYERHGEREREARLAVGEWAGVMANAMQTIDWFVWRAARRPATFDSAAIDAYDADMQRLLPSLMASMTNVAAIAVDGFKRFEPFTEEVFVLDHDVTSCATRFASDAAGALRDLATHEDRSDDLFRRFQAELSAWATRGEFPAGETSKTA
jgi:hypothetical protein